MVAAAFGKAVWARGTMPKPMSPKPSLVGDGGASKTAAAAEGAGKAARPLGADARSGGGEGAKPGRGLVLKHTCAAPMGDPCTSGARAVGHRGGVVVAMGGRALLRETTAGEANQPEALL
mmetsp:Transcript_10054/g.25157  ORF Transcript_10054/g.25157 Transcript_10054/m.25157 type:complete len:120 (-) Transcript_10054:11-370(-)